MIVPMSSPDLTTAERTVIGLGVFASMAYNDFQRTGGFV